MAELEYARGYLPMWAGPPLQGGICARLLVNKHGRLITTVDFDQRAFISLVCVCATAVCLAGYLSASLPCPWRCYPHIEHR